MQAYCKLLIALLGIFTCCSLQASEAGQRWFIKPYAGISQLADLDADFDSIDSLSGEAKINLDTGFTAGIGIGYWLTKQVALEFAWEYRSNDSEVNLADQSRFNDGNYASNTFFLNGYYAFKSRGLWQPYIGAGLSWLQEIDIDLERGGRELSYSGDGDIGYQVFAGINYQLNKRWGIGGEVRYSRITGIDLTGEAGAEGSFSDADYTPVTLQIGMTYHF